MNLSEPITYAQVLGSIIKRPTILEEINNQISIDDFDTPVAQLIFLCINNCLREYTGQSKLSIIDPVVIDSYVQRTDVLKVKFEQEHGMDFLLNAIEISEEENFHYYYERLRKLSLLRKLKKEKYDISYFFHPTNSIKEDEELETRFEEATLVSIINQCESKLADIRQTYLSGISDGSVSGTEFRDLKESFKAHPDFGADLEGDIFNMAFRGAREGTLICRSASSGTGKTRLSVFDACSMMFPIRWNHDEQRFVLYDMQPTKTLIITTEMDKDEIQSIILAYIAGVNEDHIISGRYELNEEARVDFAVNIIEKYKDYCYIEKISDPDLNSVKSVITKNVIINQVKVVCYDYIFSSPALITQFSSARVREDVALGMMSNQLKELAREYGLSIITSTQVNAEGMNPDREFKDEGCIRGSRAVADKIDGGCVVYRASEEDILKVRPYLAKLTPDKRDLIPTHVFDVYKMRRGRYKNVKIWSCIDLGTGNRKDLLMTTPSCKPVECLIKAPKKYSIVSMGENAQEPASEESRPQGQLARKLEELMEKKEEEEKTTLDITDAKEFRERRSGIKVPTKKNEPMLGMDD